MLCCLVRLYKKVKRAITRAAAVLAWRVDRRLRQIWTAHGSRVASDATYAAVTALVLGGAFGMVPVKDVFAAVLAAVLGVHTASGRSSYRPRAASCWNDDWGLA